MADKTQDGTPTKEGPLRYFFRVVFPMIALVVVLRGAIGCWIIGDSQQHFLTHDRKFRVYN